MRVSRDRMSVGWSPPGNFVSPTFPSMIESPTKALFYCGDWIKKPGVAIVSCNDGLRPVIMKLEATDEGSKIDYEPVER